MKFECYGGLKKDRYKTANKNVNWLTFVFEHVNKYILFNGMEPFDQIVNILSTEGPKLKIVQENLERKTSKDFTILYMYIAQGQGQITPKNFDSI